MKISSNLIEIFQESINEYHIKDSVDQIFENKFLKNQVFESMMYKKAWIDTVQWHLEDIIRKPSINPKEALVIKRRIDKSNQDRTDMVRRNGRPRFDGLKFHLVFHVTKSFLALWLSSSVHLFVSP